MSLEANIKELTEAVRDLISAMQPTGSYVDQEGNGSASATTPKSSPAPAPTPTKSSGGSKPKEDAKRSNYDEVKAAILAIAAKNREHATALLQRYGAKTGKDLKEEQWAGFHADAQRVIAGVYDPTAGE